MFQKPCRLSKYDKAYFGAGQQAQGGSTDIKLRDPKKEQKTVGNWYGFQQDQFKDFVANNPLLNAAQGGALSFFNQLPATLSSLQDQFGGLPQQLQQQFGGLPEQLQHQFGNLPQQLQNQFGQLPETLKAQFGGLPKELMGLTHPLEMTAKNYLSGILGSQGRLSPEASRDVAQQTRQLANQYGAGRQLGTLGTELLNRQGAREARYNTALGQYNAATGQIGILDQLAQGLGTSLAQTRQGLGVGLAQARQGLGTNLAQVRQGLGTGLASTREALGTGLAGAIQNLQSGGLNQLNTTASNAINAFATQTNPILSYLGNLFSNNLQGQIAQAGINQQGNIAGDNKTSGAISGILSSIGSVAGAVAMSDERVKQKIRDTGVTTKEGVPLKTWEYKTRPGVRFLSPLAQDVEKKLPNQVLTDPVSGVKFVVGFPVIQISPMERKAA